MSKYTSNPSERIIMPVIRKIEDDEMSFCGSISGETFASRRRKNTCTLRKHSVDILAKKLRELPAGYEKQAELDKKPRFNNSFHNFRFVVVMLGGLFSGSMLLLRFNITVAILKMVNQTALYEREHPNKTMDELLAEGFQPGGEFVWDNEIQQMIMSWYMVAYTLPQLPATKLSIMIGSRWAMSGSLLICALATLLTPLSAYYGWQWVVGLRLINGIGASPVIPMLIYLIENWMPYEETQLGLTCAQILQSTLVAANPLIIGYLSAIHWSYAFYIPGLVSIIFCVIFIILVTDRPDENWIISQKEIDLICGCTIDHDHSLHDHKSPGNNGAKNDGDSNDDGTYQPAWYDIFRVPSFYFYILLWSLYAGTMSAFVFTLPTYLAQFLKVTVAQNGTLCFIILSGTLAAILWPHPFVRIMQRKFDLSLTCARRVAYTLTCSMAAITWIYVGLFHESQLPLLFLNRSFQGSNDVIVTGSIMSNYAKTGMSSMVFSMVNTVANLSVVPISTSIGYLLDYTGQSRQGWTWIFSALGGSQLLMLIIFLTLIRSEPIEFRRKNNADESDDEKTTTTRDKSADKIGENGRSASDTLEVVVKKGHKGSLNNFEKLRQVEGKESKQIV